MFSNESIDSRSATVKSARVSENRRSNLAASKQRIPLYFQFRKRFAASTFYSGQPISLFIQLVPPTDFAIHSARSTNRVPPLSPFHRLHLSAHLTDRFPPPKMAEFLPDLPLIKIFRHLGLVDLTRARAVSRRWKSLIDGCVRIDELVICPDISRQPFGSWCLLNNKVNRNSALELDLLDAAGFLKFNQKIVRLHLLSSLKRLKIRDFSKNIHAYDVAGLFSALAKFTALEHLEIEYLSEYPPDNLRELTCALVHPNLKVLHLDLGEPCRLHISIDCPRLEFLKCYASDEFTIIHPETIKQLYYYHFGHRLSNMEAFANLELYAPYDAMALDGVNIWCLPKLKELRVVYRDCYWLDDYSWYVRSILTGLIAENERLGLADSLKIYLNDRECSTNLKDSHPFLFRDEKRTEDDSEDEW